MGPKDISTLIEAEIAGNWSITNLHNCDLKACLVRPRKRKALFPGGQIREVWVVLEEDPLNYEGFKIVFDDISKAFGLAEYSEPYHVLLNSHRTFLAAFRSM